MIIKFTEKEYALFKDILAKIKLTPEVFGVNDKNMSIMMNESLLISWVKQQPKIYDLMHASGLEKKLAPKVVGKYIVKLGLPKGIFVKNKKIKK